MKHLTCIWLDSPVFASSYVLIHNGINFLALSILLFLLPETGNFMHKTPLLNQGFHYRLQFLGIKSTPSACYATIFHVYFISI